MRCQRHCFVLNTTINLCDPTIAKIRQIQLRKLSSNDNSFCSSRALLASFSINSRLFIKIDDKYKNPYQWKKLYKKLITFQHAINLLSIVTTLDLSLCNKLVSDPLVSASFDRMWQFTRKLRLKQCKCFRNNLELSNYTIHLLMTRKDSRENR